MEDGILEIILNRVDQMSREQLEVLNQLLDIVERYPSDQAASQAPAQEEL